MNGFRITALTLGMALALAACNREREQAETAPAAMDPVDSETSGRMGGMSGMAWMDGMTNQMMSHMQTMRAASDDSMKAMLPMHRQMVANMIARMNSEMRDMNMTADTQWNATVDSLRADLKRMPEMSAQEMQDFMPAHQQRVARLLEMHRTMTKNMNM